MVFENLQVKHKAFGLGTVVNYNGKYITVKFPNAEKVFVYPDAFEKNVHPTVSILYMSFWSIWFNM